MATLNLKKFRGETGEDLFGWLTAATARLCLAPIPADLWMNAASNAFTRAANTWFSTWATENLGGLKWEVFFHSREGQYQG